MPNAEANRDLSHSEWRVTCPLRFPSAPNRKAKVLVWFPEPKARFHSSHGFGPNQNNTIENQYDSRDRLCTDMEREAKAYTLEEFRATQESLLAADVFTTPSPEEDLQEVILQRKLSDVVCCFVIFERQS
jgi:hypothetical protein